MSEASPSTDATSPATVRSLGVRVRASRRRLGLSTREAARRLRVSTRFLNELERGKPTVRLDKVLSALHGLGLDLAVEELHSAGVGERLLAEVRARIPALRAIAARHGAKALWLFGSAARGAARPDSDLDFIVDLERTRSLVDLAGMKQDLESLFKRRVDLFTRAALKRGILKNAAADQVRVL